MKQIQISKESARFFYEQCCGEFTGHMAMVPNNPVMHGLCKAYEVKCEHSFAQFLDAVSKALTQDPESF